MPRVYFPMRLSIIILFYHSSLVDNSLQNKKKNSVSTDRFFPLLFFCCCTEFKCRYIKGAIQAPIVLANRLNVDIKGERMTKYKQQEKQIKVTDFSGYSFAAGKLEVSALGFPQHFSSVVTFDALRLNENNNNGKKCAQRDRMK